MPTLRAEIAECGYCLAVVRDRACARPMLWYGASNGHSIVYNLVWLKSFCNATRARRFVSALADGYESRRGQSRFLFLRAAAVLYRVDSRITSCWQQAHGAARARANGC